jgi:hypothetical protein
MSGSKARRGVERQESSDPSAPEDYLAEVAANTAPGSTVVPDQQIMEADLQSAVKAYLMSFADSTLRLKVAYNLTVTAKRHRERAH